MMHQPWLLIALLTGCASSPFDRQRLSDELSQRVDQRLAEDRLPPGAAELATWNVLPPGVSLDDGLSEDEAVATALWNNAAFLSDLKTLDLSRADLVTAGMIRNPLFTLLLPLGPKQLEFTALIPIEELWQRPRRVAAAQAEVERVANSLVQTGLDLVRDTKLALIELALAKRRAVVSARMLVIRKEIERIALSRFKAGDSSHMEAEATRLDALSAEAEQTQIERAVVAANEVLWWRLGLGSPRLDLEVVQSAVACQSADALPALTTAAMSLRPDVRAAELALEGAAARLGWEKTRVVNSISAVVDANGQGLQGFEIGPGFAIELPIFNQNQGGTARARAELERAGWRHVAVRQQVELEVRQALLDCAAAEKALGVLRSDVLLAADRNVDRAHRAFAAGDVSYLAVLDASRQLLDVMMREAALQATARRSLAQLERSIGSKHAPQ